MWTGRMLARERFWSFFLEAVNASWLEENKARDRMRPKKEPFPSVNKFLLSFGGSFETQFKTARAGIRNDRLGSLTKEAFDLFDKIIFSGRIEAAKIARLRHVFLCEYLPFEEFVKISTKADQEAAIGLDAILSDDDLIAARSDRLALIDWLNRTIRGEICGTFTANGVKQGAYVANAVERYPAEFGIRDDEFATYVRGCIHFLRGMVAVETNQHTVARYFANKMKGENQSPSETVVRILGLALWSSLTRVRSPLSFMKSSDDRISGLVWAGNATAAIETIKLFHQDGNAGVFGIMSGSEMLKSYVAIRTADFKPNFNTGESSKPNGKANHDWLNIYGDLVWESPRVISEIILMEHEKRFGKSIPVNLLLERRMLKCLGLVAAGNEHDHEASKCLLELTQFMQKHEVTNVLCWRESYMMLSMYFEKIGWDKASFLAMLRMSEVTQGGSNTEGMFDGASKLHNAYRREGGAAPTSLSKEESALADFLLTYRPLSRSSV